MGQAYKTIGILDHMGYGNMGDAAIQEAVVANIRKSIPKASIVGFSLNPNDTRERHNIVCYPIQWSYPGWYESDTESIKQTNIKSKLKSLAKKFTLFYAVAKHVADFLRELMHLIRSFSVVSSLDLLIISGGGQLCELWQGPWSHPYNIFKFCLLAKLSNTPLFILGVGAGPLDSKLSKFFAKWSVKFAQYASFRDTESQSLIRSLGIRKRLHVYPDPAYFLDISGIKDVTAGNSSSSVIQKVGLNPIGYCDPRIWPRKDKLIYENYLDKLVSFSSWILAQNYSLEIFTNEISVDHRTIEDLKNRLSDCMSGDKFAKVTCRPVLSLKELLLQISGFDYVITSKFHGVIFSHLLGKPVIALSYHNKIETLMHTVGNGQYCMNIEIFNVDSLCDKFNSLVEQRHDIRSKFQIVVKKYSDALHVQFDDLFMAERPIS